MWPALLIPEFQRRPATPVELVTLIVMTLLLHRLEPAVLCTPRRRVFLETLHPNFQRGFYRGLS